MRGRPRKMDAPRDVTGRVIKAKDEAAYRASLARNLDGIRVKLGLGSLSCDEWDWLVAAAVELRKPALERVKFKEPPQVRVLTAKDEARAAERMRQNQENVAETQRTWRQNNAQHVRDRQRGYSARRRAMIKGGISGIQTRAWILAQEKVCRWCGIDCAEKFHIDHIMPLARGGEHVEENLCIACPTCNCRKGAKDPEEFYLKQKFAA